MSIVLEQLEYFWNLDTWIVQTQLSQMVSAGIVNHAVIVSGYRHAGRSTLLAQMAHRLLSSGSHFFTTKDFINAAKPFQP
jgi:ABC-type cobalamin transport system ATPase subunit